MIHSQIHSILTKWCHTFKCIFERNEYILILFFPSPPRSYEIGALSSLRCSHVPTCSLAPAALVPVAFPKCTQRVSTLRVVPSVGLRPGMLIFFLHVSVQMSSYSKGLSLIFDISKHRKTSIRIYTLMTKIYFRCYVIYAFWKLK